MRWQSPGLLFLFFLFPLLTALLVYAERERKRRIQLFGRGAFERHLKETTLEGRRLLKSFLVLVGWLCLIVALASPQTESRVKIKKKVGSEFLLALDTSLSMLARDESPDRFTRAKEEVRRLLERLEGYRVGLIIFAGTSFIQSPLTLDHSALRFFLDSVTTESLPVPGTALKKVIETARKGFRGEGGTRKILVLFTDGEDLEGEDPLPEAREANREGMTIYAIGFGSPSGSLIPIYEKGAQAGYKTDPEGVAVVTRLEAGMLSEIANETGGRYFKTQPEGEAVNELLREISKGGKREKEEDFERKYVSRFQIPLFFAVLFLLSDLALSERR